MTFLPLYRPASARELVNPLSGQTSRTTNVGERLATSASYENGLLQRRLSSGLVAGGPLDALQWRHALMSSRLCVSSSPLFKIGRQNSHTGQIPYERGVPVLATCSNCDVRLPSHFTRMTRCCERFHCAIAEFLPYRPAMFKSFRKAWKERPNRATRPTPLLPGVATPYIPGSLVWSPLLARSGSLVCVNWGETSRQACACVTPLLLRPRLSASFLRRRVARFGLSLFRFALRAVSGTAGLAGSSMSVIVIKADLIWGVKQTLQIKELGIRR